MFISIFSFLLKVKVYAEEVHLVPESGKESGDYQLNDFILVAVNVAKWILIVSGSLALLAFVVGGFMFVLSGGNRDLVEKGKSSLIGATIGLLVVFLAFTAINYFMNKIGYDEAAFGGHWYSTN